MGEGKERWERDGRCKHAFTQHILQVINATNKQIDGIPFSHSPDPNARQ